MSQPVKISDELILDARLTAETAARLLVRSNSGRNSAGRSNHCSKAPEHSPYGVPERQSRFRSVWPRLIRLRDAGVSWNTSSRGRFPHYQPVAGSPGLVSRFDVDGTRTIGRFVGREFQAVSCP